MQTVKAIEDADHADGVRTIIMNNVTPPMLFEDAYEPENIPIPIPPVPPRPDLWIVMASDGESWRIPSQLYGRLFRSREVAEKCALTELSSNWIHRITIRIP